MVSPEIANIEPGPAFLQLPVIFDFLCSVEIDE
jgi:hypothetical protein